VTTGVRSDLTDDQLDRVIGLGELCTIRFEPKRQIILADFRSLEAITERMRAQMKAHKERMMAILKTSLEK
jgi:hypothetical protein